MEKKERVPMEQMNLTMFDNSKKIAEKRMKPQERKAKPSMVQWHNK